MTGILANGRYHLYAERRPEGVFAFRLEGAAQPAVGKSVIRGVTVPGAAAEAAVVELAQATEDEVKTGAGPNFEHEHPFTFEEIAANLAEVPL